MGWYEDAKRHCWAMIIVLAGIGLCVACRQPDGRVNHPTSPTATGTRVVAPTRDEVPAQTVAPLRARPVVPPPLTPSPIITGTITGTLTATPELSLTPLSGTYAP